jgi:hypothetical protein
MGAVTVPGLPGCCTGGKKAAVLRGSGQAEPPHSKLRAFVPGGQIVFLLRGELVEPVAHGVELETGDFLV